MEDAAEQAQAGAKVPAPQASRAERQSRKARAGLRRKVVVSTFLVAALFAAAGVTVGGMRARPPAIDVETTGMIAKVTRPMPDGINCHNVTFDNTSSKTIDDKVEPCNSQFGHTKPRARSMLNWYGK